MVAVIVIVGMAIPVLVRNWADVTIRSVQSEAVSDAVFYAEQLMEEIKSKRFDEVLQPPWTSETQFGALRNDENDENTRASFDDVDDFDGFNETIPGGFKTSAIVEYANVTDSVWQASGGSITDFKRVSVSVSWSKFKGGNLNITTVVGKY